MGFARGGAALLPAALLALFAGWSGTFYYGASAAAVAGGHLALLAATAWGWRTWDPLRLGPRGKALPPLLWLWLLLSMRASPVPRAGWVAAALLPVFLALPAVVARCWSGAAARRVGALTVAGVAGATGAVALAGMAWQGSPRAAQPLGNAVVLGVFLATLLPLALVAAAGEASPMARRAALVALVLAAAGLLATRSVGTLGAALVGTALVLPRRRRGWLLVALALGALTLGPRMVLLATGRDDSMRARWVYWQGGGRGVLARPLLGWGPGSTAWTVAPFLRPRPGVNPPGEVVADLHGVPLQLAYELGLPGLAGVVAVGLAFLRARGRERAQAVEEGEPTAPDLRRGGLAGLAAGAAGLAVGPTLGTTAPWVALALAAGAALAGSAAAPAAPLPTMAPTREPARGRLRSPPIGWLAAALALLLLAPLDAAIACYDAARHSPPRRRAALLGLAAELDPGMPLYRARLGWDASSAPVRAVALGRAAAAAPGVAALQLAAGWAAQAAGRGGEQELAQACASDRLSGPAPFLLSQARPRAAWAPRLAARALLADPPLLAALAWQQQPALLAAALVEAARWEGVDAGLRQAVVDAAAKLPRGGRAALLRVTMDEEPSAAVSLHVFRRLPWRATLAVVPVHRAAAAALGRLPAAGALSTTSAGSFAEPCFDPGSVVP